MMRAPSILAADNGGSAATEMALVMPLLLVILFGSLELGNYFMNEHTLVKAVRNGARFAARQNFTNYPDCSTVSTDTRDDTRNVVMNGYLSGGTIITPNIDAADITVTTSCATEVGAANTPMTGIYFARTDGAQIVTVTASVDYRPVLAAFGFSGVGFKLNASSEAAVAGI
jgi:Flp pilus assembly protein TadG